MKDQKMTKMTRRNRTVQRELKCWRWWAVRDLKQRWKMKQRERRERRRRVKMNSKVIRSRAESRYGNVEMINMDRVASSLIYIYIYEISSEKFDDG